MGREEKFKVGGSRKKYVGRRKKEEKVDQQI